MVGVLIIPTGIGAEIGGHAGDGNPVAKLLASCCDILITHPNVVNASDINEMTENTLYVEGSMLDRFLEGNIELEPVKTYNKILLVANKPITNETINAVNAARVTIGADIEVLQLEQNLVLESWFIDGVASGEVSGWENLLKQISNYTFDVLALHTPIYVDRDVALNYLQNVGINPWGGVEAKVSKILSVSLNKPVAHAPIENINADDKELFFIYKNKVVDPRIASEVISNCYLHSVLKGLHRAPRIGEGLSFKDVDFMVSPFGCFGRPHQACIDNGIPIIVVKENKTCLNAMLPFGSIVVENYWEAVGIIMSMKAGVHYNSVRRP